MSEVPGMQDRKTAEPGKNPLGPLGEKKVCYLEKKGFCRFGTFFFSVERKMPAVGDDHLRPRTVSRNGNIRRYQAEGPGFEPRRDGSLVETVTFVAVRPKVPGSNLAGTSI